MSIEQGLLNLSELTALKRRNIHNSPQKFFETVYEFYKQNVYFLDADGYLDYDFNIEGIVGSNLNPDISYWTNEV